MKFSKFRNVKTPTRGTKLSAGLDFYIPEDAFRWANGQIILRPGEDINIPSGIKVKVPSGYALIAFNKSGQALKKNLQVGAQVVDEDYQGEIHLHVRNTGTGSVELKAGEKLVQFLLIPVMYAELEEVPQTELFREITDRGSGGFGSTGV